MGYSLPVSEVIKKLEEAGLKVERLRTELHIRKDANSSPSFMKVVCDKVSDRRLKAILNKMKPVPDLASVIQHHITNTAKPTGLSLGNTLELEASLAGERSSEALGLLDSLSSARMDKDDWKTVTTLKTLLGAWQRQAGRLQIAAKEMKGK